MRGSFSRTGTSTGLTRAALVALVAAIGCERTWDLPGQLGGSSGGGRIMNTGSGGGAAGPGGGSGGLSGSAGKGASGGSSQSGSGGRFPNCGFPLSSNVAIANVLFLVGRNQSMNDPFGDTTRMKGVATAVLNVVTANQQLVNFGYQDFPGTGCMGSTTCCASMDFPVIPGRNNYKAIEGALACEPGPSSSGEACVRMSDARPVWQALKSLTFFATSDGSSNQRYVILVIDGPPGCSTEDAVDSCKRALEQVTTLSASKDVTPVVVALGDSAPNDPCLSQMALASGVDVFSSPQEATDTKNLTAVLNQIVSRAAPGSCTIDLYMAPTDTRYVSLILDGVVIPRSMKDGWDFSAANSTTRIQVNGSYCATFQGRGDKGYRVMQDCPP